MGRAESPRPHKMRNRLVAGTLSAAILAGGGFATARLASEATNEFNAAQRSETSLVQTAGNGTQDLVAAGIVGTETLFGAVVPPLVVYTRNKRREGTR